MKDKIILKGLRFYAHHGVTEAERQLGQQFVVDLELEIDLEEAAKSDKIEKTVDYQKVYEIVKAIIEGEPKQLLEALAEEIAGRILEKFPDVAEVEVGVKKPQAPIKAALMEYVGVEIERRRK